MGKVRRLRQKYQASLDKDGKEKGSLHLRHSSGSPKSVRVVKKKAVRGLKTSDRLTDIHIKFKKTFGNQDKSFNQQKKSDTKNKKRRQRREELLKKIDGTQVVERAEKDRKKREKSVIVGDMHQILNALPSIEELSSSSKMDVQISKKDKETKGKKQTHEEYLSNIWMFMKAHQDPLYKENPFDVVAQAVKNRVLNGDS